jgi:cytochrome c biogenesis protein CcdA
MTSSIPSRTPYQGLVQIFRFNRPFYLRTAAGTITAIILSLWLPVAFRTVLLLATGAAVFGRVHRFWSRTTSTIDLACTSSAGCMSAFRNIPCAGSIFIQASMKSASPLPRCFRVRRDR